MSPTPTPTRHFYADMQMYTTTMSAPDPEDFMRQFVSWEIASKANKWQGRNVPRWKNEEYDSRFKASQNELDPVKRAALFIKMNDLVVGDPGVIPDVYRPRVDAMAKNLRVPLSGWDNDFWNLARLVSRDVMRIGNPIGVC